LRNTLLTILVVEIHARKQGRCPEIYWNKWMQTFTQIRYQTGNPVLPAAVQVPLQTDSLARLIPVHTEGMTIMRSSTRCRRGLLLLVSCFFATSVMAQPTPAADAKPHTTRHAPKRLKAGKPQLDRSGKVRKGKASYYAKSFAGKKMADGTPMDPNANIAASRTLPLGTKVQVTNLENGRSAVVEIRDRGPYVDGRIVDLSPKVAKKLNMLDDGVAPVVVAPIEVPQADGSIKPGDGALPATELAQEDAAR
jgi:rare lipoprotein A